MRIGATSIADCLVIVRGGGDLATGVVWRLHRSGFPVLVTELHDPLTVRRTVAVSSAVTDGTVTIEGMRADRVDDLAAAARIAMDRTVVPVVVEPALPALGQCVVVDARLAKRNIDTRLDDAPIVVALGPGFTAGVDCHAVIETMRGHRLGRVILDGSALANTGTPGEIGGRAAERVVRAPLDGTVTWRVRIGDIVGEGDVLGVAAAPSHNNSSSNSTGNSTDNSTDNSSSRTDNRAGRHVELRAVFPGLVRGLIRSGHAVPAGLKIADVDPRIDPDAVWTISDKALAVGGGVLEAVLSRLAEGPGPDAHRRVG